MFLGHHSPVLGGGQRGENTPSLRNQYLSMVGTGGVGAEARGGFDRETGDCQIDPSDAWPLGTKKSRWVLLVPKGDGQMVTSDGPPGTWSVHNRLWRFGIDDVGG